MNKQEYLAKKEKEARENNNSSACEWITVDELQSKLKISRSTVYRWIKNNALRAYRFEHSRNLYFLNEEVDRFLSLNPIAPSGRLDKVGLMMMGSEKGSEDVKE
jgi:excisionase family DNA binding protein